MTKLSSYDKIHPNREGCFYLKRFEYNFKHSRDDILYLRKNLSFDAHKNEDIIFNYLIQGCTCEEISKQTGWCERTIQRRRKGLYYKINECINNKDTKENCDDIITDKYVAQLKSQITFCVYILILPNHKMYVGQTHSSERRWKNGHGYQQNEVLYNDILEYGWKNIIKAIVHDNLTYKASLEKEKELILLYKTYLPEFGYNKYIGQGGKR